jgi:hypothetical protein
MLFVPRYFNLLMASRLVYNGPFLYSKTTKALGTIASLRQHRNKHLREPGRGYFSIARTYAKHVDAAHDSVSRRLAEEMAINNTDLIKFITNNKHIIVKTPRGTEPQIVGTSLGSGNYTRLHSKDLLRMAKQIQARSR